MLDDKFEAFRAENKKDHDRIIELVTGTRERLSNLEGRWRITLVLLVPIALGIVGAFAKGCF